MADGTFDLSAVMRFDGKQAVQGANEVRDALKGVAGAQREAAAAGKETGTPSRGGAGDAKAEAAAKREAAAAAREKAKADREAEAATKRLAAEEAKLERQLAALRARLDPVAEGQRRTAQATDLLSTALARGKINAEQHDAALAKLTGGAGKAAAAQKVATAELNRAAFGARNAGQQVGDFFTQVSLGGGVMRAFSSQAGQMGFALSEMGGKAGKVGAFLTGPWGIALTVAAVLLAPFAEKLFDSADAADELRDKLDKAATSSDAFGNAQSLLGKVIDLQTGKLKTQNLELRETIRLQAEAGLLAAQKAEKDAREAIGGIGKVSLLQRIGAATASDQGFSGDVLGGIKAEQAPLRSLARDVLTNNLDATEIRKRVDTMAAAGQLAGKTTEQIIELKNQLFDLPRALNDKAANQAAIDALDGKGIDRRLVPYKAPGKPKSTAAVDEFGRDAADKIAALRDQFNETPPVIAAVNKQLAQLDDLVDDLARKKPPGFEKLIADARALRPLIEEGLNRPYRDYLRQQTEALDVQRLITAGRIDEAAALKVVQGLERDMGALTLEQRDAVLATVQAMRAQQREADILREKQQAYLNALGSIRSAVRGAIFEGVGGLEALPGRLVKAFATLKGEQLFDRIFAGAFRELEDQVNGTSVVKDASDRMAKAVDKATRSSDTLGAAFDRLAAKVNGATAPGAGGAGAAASGLATVLDASGRVVGTFPAPDAPPPDIVVTGKKTPTSFFENALAKLSKGVGISEEGAKTIGKYGGKALEGAAQGALVNSFLQPLGKALGFKTSKTGAQIGGAVGGLTMIPGGQEIGAVIGSLAGGALKKTKSGAVSLDNAYDGAQAYGNDKESRGAATGLAKSVQSGLQSIAQQLGGQLGGFNVTVGQRHGDYRVTTGSSLKVKKGATDFNDDAEAANAYAIQLAITQGAVTGLSAAVQRALSSSDDISTGLAEALKVKDLEKLIGGLGSALKAQFDDFDAVAAERVRIARRYGLDLVAVEKINGEQRAKLVADTLSSRIGSLSDFLANTKYGDLAEGSASDKRRALLDQIGITRGAAENGDDGAADKLAALLTQLTTSTRDKFGTAAPEFATDRATSISAAERVIQMETDRVNAAANATAQAIALQNEGNNLQAITNSKLDELIALQRQTGSDYYDPYSTSRYAYDAGVY